MGEQISKYQQSLSNVLRVSIVADLSDRQFDNARDVLPGKRRSRRIALNLLLLGENGSPQAGALLNPPAWSLAIELQFYLVAPFLIWALRYRVALVATLTVGFVFWLVYASGTGQIYLIHFIFLFALGIAFAQRPMNGRAVALSPYSLVALALCGIAAADATIGALITEHGLLRFAAIATGLLGLPYVAASLTRKSHAGDRVLGDLAYPVYLLHWPVKIVVVEWFPASFKLPVAITLTMILSLAVYALLDRPLEKLRRKFVEARRRSATFSLVIAGAP